jgi:hypothetical protein
MDGAPGHRSEDLPLDLLQSPAALFARTVFGLVLGPRLANAYAPESARTGTRVDDAVAASINCFGSRT